MSKYTKSQMKSFFEDVTRYVEEVYDKKLVLHTSIGPALAISFKTVDDFSDFIITVVSQNAVDTDIRVSTEACIDYARSNPEYITEMPAGKLADSIAFSGLALALLDVGVTPVEHPTVYSAVLAQVMPFVAPTDPEKEKDGAQTLRSLLLELLKDLEEAK